MKSVSEGEKTLVTAAIYRGSKNGTAYVECVIFFLVSPMRREPASSRAKHLLLSSFVSMNVTTFCLVIATGLGCYVARRSPNLIILLSPYGHQVAT